jgi:signal transduction histidine kinase
MSKVARTTGVGSPKVLGAVAATAGAITLLVSVLPFVRFAYRSPEAHVAIDTAATVIALLGAFLLFQRFRRTAARGDLLLVAALAMFALANLCLSVAPALAGRTTEPISTWALLAARLIGAGLLAAACFAAPRTLRAPSATARWALIACLATIGSLALLAIAFAAALPHAIDPALAPDEASRPRVVGHPLILVGQLVGMVLFAGAAIGFARRAARERDEFLSWLAVAATLGAFSRLNYFLFPSQFTDFVFTGDAFVLACHLVLLVAAAREIDVYHRRLVEMAVLEERRRVARDLHDGLAQELAFIAAQCRSSGPVRMDQLASAAERALDDSRAVITALSRPFDEPLESALARAAAELAERFGARAPVELELERPAHVPPAVRDGLVKIMREAMTNAVRHGAAREVAVSLSGAGGVTLRVADDGCGFDAERPPRRPGGGFGLISMRERAEALGGAFAIVSTPGAGTKIEVVVPWTS